MCGRSSAKEVTFRVRGRSEDEGLGGGSSRNMRVEDPRELVVMGEWRVV